MDEPGKSSGVIQVSLAVVTLMSAGVLVHTLANLKHIDPGFDAHNLLVFGIDPPQGTYKQPGQIDGMFRDLQQRFAALPGVTSVSYSWAPLLNGWMWRTTFRPPNGPENAKDRVDILPVGPRFFETMRIPFKMGADFSSADFAMEAARPVKPGAQADPSSPPTPVVANEAFVRRYLPGMNPIGQHIEADLPSNTSQNRGPGWLIIGVVGDAKYSNLRDELSPAFYKPSVSNAFFTIRSAGDPMGLVAAVREAVNRRDSGLAMFDITSESEKIDALLASDRYLAGLSSVFAALALALACIGVFGLLSYEATRRRREIGIRFALGAQRSNIVAMVVRQGLLLALAGAVIGGLSSLAVKHLLESVLYKVTFGDPITLAAVAGLLLVVALVACYLPARRATRVDPLVALRYE